MEKKKYGFVKMRKEEAIILIVTLVLIVISVTVLVKPTIMGISASMWLLCAVSLVFPIMNLIKTQKTKSTQDK